MEDSLYQKGFSSFADAIVPQANHDFEAFCLGGRKYGTWYSTRRILERRIDLCICPDNGELLGVRIELFQGCTRWVRRNFV